MRSTAAPDGAQVARRRHPVRSTGRSRAARRPAARRCAAGRPPAARPRRRPGPIGSASDPCRRRRPSGTGRGRASTGSAGSSTIAHRCGGNGSAGGRGGGSSRGSASWHSSAVLAEQGPARRAPPGHGPRRDARDGVVGAVGQGEHEPLRATRRQPPAGHGPVGRDHAGEADRGPVAQQTEQPGRPARRVGVVQQGAQRLDAVDEQQERRAPGRPWPSGAAGGDLAAEPVHQPHRPEARPRRATVVPGVRQRLRPSAASAPPRGLDDVHVQFVGAEPVHRLGAAPCGAAWCGRCGGRRPPARCRPRPGRWRAARGTAGRAGPPDRWPAASRPGGAGPCRRRRGRQVVGAHAVGQRRSPRPVGAGPPERLGACRDRSAEPGQVACARRPERAPTVVRRAVARAAPRTCGTGACRRAPGRPPRGRSGRRRGSRCPTRR